MSKQKRFNIVEKILTTVFIVCLIVTLITAFTRGLDSQTIYWVTPVLIGIPVLWLIYQDRKGRLYDESVYFPFSDDNIDSELHNLTRGKRGRVRAGQIFNRESRRLPWEPFDIDKYMMRPKDEKEKQQDK